MTRRAGSFSLLGIASLAISVAAAPAGAEWFRLSQGQAFSGVLPAGYALSPDGRRVVYWHNSETSIAYELWSVHLPSGAPVSLSGPVPFLGLGRFSISPDSSRVVYLAEQDTSGVVELYSVPIAGPASAGVKLNGALVAGGDVSPFRIPQISPNGSRVVYMADQQIDEVFELYSVPIAGPASAGVKLNGALIAGGDVDRLEISPNSSRVVYRADQQTNDVFELYSVPIAGPASAGVKLNGSLVAGGAVSNLRFEISPDSARVVYLADQQTDEVWELFGVPIAGPASAGVKLNGALVAGGDVDREFAISPDGARVVYLADRQTDEVWELYSVPIAGPASAGFKLNGPLVANGDVEAFAISPNSAWAVYAADQELDGWPMGYRALLAGPAGSDERIWASAVNIPSEFAILPDSSAVAVLGNSAFIDGIVRLWTYPLAGTPDWEGTDWLGGEFQPNGDATGFVLLPDGSGAVYRADQEVDEQFELYLLYFRLWGDGFETGDTGRWSDTVP